MCKHATPYRWSQRLHPPQLLEVTPANLSLNFKETEIVLTFDEFIKTVNPGKEFSISPDVPTQPIYKVRKKTSSSNYRTL